MKRFLAMSIFVILLVAVSVAGLQAGTKKIRPDELVPRTSETMFRRDPISISSNSSSFAQFHAVVKLPIGSTVKKLNYYHVGVGPSPETYVILERIKMGGLPETLVRAESIDNSGDIISVVEPVVKNNRVTSGYTYYVIVYSQGTTSSILGIKISYR